MKLKRLLLRYNPAGVGLEWSKDDGELQVLHRDLPKAQGDDCSMAEVRVLADEIIDGEPALLSKKKHHGALVQLLCRLYKVEEEAEAAEAGEERSPKKKKDKKEKRDSILSHETIDPSTLSVGDKIILAGLKTPHTAHNGYVGTVVKLRDKGKVEVIPEDIEDFEPISVKRAPLLRIQERPTGAKSGDIPIGSQVSITRLRNHGALNGTIGRVVEFNQTTSRYEIRATETGQLFRVKPDNVVALWDQTRRSSLSSMVETEMAQPASQPQTSDTITVGCVVALFGLKNAASLNGAEAEVLSIDEEKGRMDIRLKHDGSVKKVRSENVRFVMASSGEQDSVPEFQPRQAVQLCNLRSAAALNGEKAMVIRKDVGTNRYEIRMESDGSTKKVRRENLEPC